MPTKHEPKKPRDTEFRPGAHPVWEGDTYHQSDSDAQPPVEPASDRDESPRDPTKEGV